MSDDTQETKTVDERQLELGVEIALMNARVLATHAKAGEELSDGDHERLWLAAEVERYRRLFGAFQLECCDDWRCAEDHARKAGEVLAELRAEVERRTCKPADSPEAADGSEAKPVNAGDVDREAESMFRDQVTSLLQPSLWNQCRWVGLTEEQRNGWRAKAAARLAETAQPPAASPVDGDDVEQALRLSADVRDDMRGQWPWFEYLTLAAEVRRLREENAILDAKDVGHNERAALLMKHIEWLRADRDRLAKQLAELQSIYDGLCK